MPVRLIDLFSGWEKHNALLIKMLSPLGDEELSLSAGSGLWPVRVLACHIVSARAWWFNAWMNEGDEELKGLITIDDEEIEKPTRDAPAICAALEKSWSDVNACLHKWTENDLDASFRRPTPNASGERPWRDRRFIIWHVAEHDVHHGGEISLTLGMHGRRGIDL